jgi:hypothetical protein
VGGCDFRNALVERELAEEVVTKLAGGGFDA